MSDKIIEKLNEIETTIESKTSEKIDSVKTELEAKLDEKVVSFDEKVAALEAKMASVQSPSIIKVAKTISGDVNRRVKEALAEYVKAGGRKEKELTLFADEAEHQAFVSEASALTGSGYDQGGRTGYDPVFVALRLANPMRGVSRNVSTDGSVYQFRAKTGNAGAGWGYAIQNNGAATTENTNIWQLVLKDLNVQFPIRTAALDDIDGLEANVVQDMLLEFSQQEALSMIQNDDQGATSLPYGGSNGLRGLNQYPGAAATYSGGETTVSAFGTSGTASTDGLHDVATYDQLTTNGNGSVNEVTYKDVVNFIYALPQQYWTPTARFIVNPLMLGAIRGLVDDYGRPIYVDGLAREDGIVGKLLGFDVVVNKYLDNPTGAGASPGTVDKFPMYFGDFNRAHAIVDRLNMVLRRYDQTLPGFITFFGEKRLATSVVDPFALVRYRSTATAN